MARTSRYDKPRFFAAVGAAAPVYAGFRPRAIGPATGVIEHTVAEGERLDNLARHYYNDDRLWWRIVDANPEFFFGGDIVRAGAGAGPALDGMVGRVIRIPRGRE